MRSTAQIAVLGCLVVASNATPFELDTRQSCGNNCARAVIANAYPNRPTKVDCSSYLAVTTTLPAVTVTATVFLPTVNTLVKRQTSKTIPAYASACSSPAAYINACACIGVTPYTVAAPIPTSTVTVSVSPSTTTSTPAVTLTSTTSTPPGPTATTLRNGNFEDLPPTIGFDITQQPSNTFDLVVSTDARRSGVRSLHIHKPTSPPGELSTVSLSQYIGVDAQTEYEVGFYFFKPAAYGAGCSARTYFTTSSGLGSDGVHFGSYTLRTAEMVDNTWTRTSGRFTTAAGVSRGWVVVEVQCDIPGPITVFVDDVEFRKVAQPT